MNNLSKPQPEAREAKNVDTEPSAAPTTFKPDRKGTRQAQLVALLQRKSGASIAQIIQRLGWQAHTARAALTGLRKRGYAVERITKDGKASQYHIRAMAKA